MYKARCTKGSSQSGLMFIIGETYLVKKCKYLTLNKYVIVHGKFTDTKKETKILERVISADICRKHLEIVK